MLVTIVLHQAFVLFHKFLDFQPSKSTCLFHVFVAQFAHTAHQYSRGKMSTRPADSCQLCDIAFIFCKHIQIYVEKLINIMYILHIVNYLLVLLDPICVYIHLFVPWYACVYTCTLYSKRQYMVYPKQVIWPGTMTPTTAVFKHTSYATEYVCWTIIISIPIHSLLHNKELYCFLFSILPNHGQHSLCKE